MKYFTTLITLHNINLLSYFGYYGICIPSCKMQPILLHILHTVMWNRLIPCWMVTLYFRIKTCMTEVINYTSKHSIYRKNTSVT